MAKKVLIVDDEFSILDLLTVVLRGMDYSVDTASNGLEALKKLGAYVPDLIILDINMPKMNGWEVLRAIRAQERTRTVPVVMCTSRSLVADVENADRLGATAYITKP